ncbi:MAG: hypothetical protein U0893_14595 [Chloroflexota bacterium]
MLAASDQVLDQMAGMVGSAIEGAGAVFGTELGERESDVPSSQIGPVLAAGVDLVADDTGGPLPWAARPRPADGAEAEEPIEHRRLVLLTRRQHDRQRLAGTVSLEMDLSGHDVGRDCPLALLGLQCSLRFDGSTLRLSQFEPFESLGMRTQRVMIGHKLHPPHGCQRPECAMWRAEG